MSLGANLFAANSVQIARPRCPLHPTTAFTLVSDTAYWVYLGYVADLATLAYVRFVVRTAGSGAQTAEVAFASTPNHPNRGSQTLTKIVASGSLDALTATGVRANSSSLATALTEPVHLWAGVRTAMATSQPAVVGCMGDFSDGFVLETAAAGALTGSGPWTGSVPAFQATAPIAPYLIGALT